LKACKITDLESKRYRAKQKEQKAKADQNVEEVDGAEMVNILSCLDSNKSWDVFAGLLLATGRRPVELLKVGKFKVAKEHEIEFSGQLKKFTNSSYTFPTLAPAKFLVEKI